ncbi:MAG: hypothetical protein ACJAUG_002128 [Halioglobus sp.]|jgi:hypothetical protein
MAWANSRCAKASNSAGVILGSGSGLTTGFGLGFTAGFIFTTGFGFGLGFTTGFGFATVFGAGLDTFFLGFSSLTSTNLALITLGAGFTFTTDVSWLSQFTVIAPITNACNARVASIGRTITRGATGLA